MNIIIAEKQYLTRTGIYSLVKEQIQDVEITEINNSGELLNITPEDHIEILIIDPDSFRLDDMVELSVFRKRNSDTSVLVLSGNKHYSYIRKILDTGVINFIFKDCERGTFIDALHAAIKKKRYFDNDLLDIILSRKNKDINEVVELTPTEKVIVRLIAQGLTTKEIASKRFLSVHTVITHRKNIFRKLNINKSSELLMYAVKTGILDTTEYYI